MKIVLLSLCALIAIVCADTWDSSNDPHDFSTSLEYDFSKLKTQGRLTQPPWSDSYWPSYESGIAHRWYSNNPQDFDYKLYSQDDLKKMSSEDKQSLSPAEKYDIYMGRYDYPTVHSEWKRTSAEDAKWEGLCHGWAPASLYYQQPNPVTLSNRDGISIPFGSSDIKALLIYFAAEYQDRSHTSFLAERCQYDIQESPQYADSPACADINAGAFHVILTNQIGSQQEGFVIDRDRSIQVWNQPLAGYTTETESVQPTLPRASSAKRVITQITYAKETVPSWDAHEPYFVSEKYDYVLEFDSNNRIIGGTHNTWDRPDFAWKIEMSEFNNYFASLKNIYESSVNGSARDVRARSVKRERVENHIELTSENRCFGTVGYSTNQRMSWSIRPSIEDAHKDLIISFEFFATERYRDKVKVYEGANGEGALVAVLHGEEIPEDLHLSTSSAYIVFKSDDVVNNKGFHACFTWL